MMLDLAGFDAEGPFFDVTEIRNASGVYAIVGAESRTSMDWDVIDVGESGRMRSRLRNHDRAACWSTYGYKAQGIAVIYTDKERRECLERILCRAYEPPCSVVDGWHL